MDLCSSELVFVLRWCTSGSRSRFKQNPNIGRVYCSEEFLLLLLFYCCVLQALASYSSFFMERRTMWFNCPDAISCKLSETPRRTLPHSWIQHSKQFWLEILRSDWSVFIFQQSRCCSWKWELDYYTLRWTTHQNLPPVYLRHHCSPVLLLLTRCFRPSYRNRFSKTFFFVLFPK